MNCDFVFRILGVVCAYLISAILHGIALIKNPFYFINPKQIYKRTAAIAQCSKLETNKKHCKKRFLSFIQWVITFDFFLSSRCKKIIESDCSYDKNKIKIKRGDYIKRVNTCNLCVSLLLIMLIYMIDSMGHDIALKICIGILSGRIVSRTLEIDYAFFKDVTSTEDKNSNINNGERIVLAVKSLFEEAFLFSGAYLLIGEAVVDSIVMGAHSLIVYLAAYNIDVSEVCDWFKLVPVYQLFCSLILVTFSLVSYISNVKNVQTNQNGKS